MKLVRYGQLGEEKPGLIDSNGNIRDLSHYVNDFTPQSLGNTELLQHISTLNPENLPFVTQPVRYGACVGSPGKIVCIGFNTLLHTLEMGATPVSEKEMVIFIKPNSALCGANDPILYTRVNRKLDWEAELGIIIGKKGKYIEKSEAKEHILGYACINDISDRYLQLETEDTQFTKGKGLDNSAPVGPFLVTKDEIQNASNLQIKLWVNDILRQNFNTSDYIHNEEEVISYISQFFTLYPGDIISMGSAPGSARTWGENMFLKPDDKILFSITGLGQQEKTVISEPLGQWH